MGATEIRAALRRLNQQFCDAAILVGEAIAVDEGDATIDVQPADGGAVYYSVRLRAADADSGMGVIAVPAVGAQVICAMDSAHSGIMLYATKVDKYSIRLSDSIAIEGSNSGWVINGGNNGGVVLVEKLVDKLNKLERRVNDLLLWMKTHVHTSSAPGAPTTTPILPTGMLAAVPLIPSQKVELSNEKLSH